MPAPPLPPAADSNMALQRIKKIVDDGSTGSMKIIGISNVCQEFFAARSIHCARLTRP